MLLAADYAKLVWLPWLERSVRVILILAGAWLASWIARRTLKRLRISAVRAMNKRGDVSAIEQEKRAATIGAVIGKLANVVIWLGAGMMVLNELTFNVQPLLAGLGVLGLAVGLGAQALIKDWLGGLLILLEDQIRIGDAVTINGIAGAVEEINLRTTVLRSENGAVHVISNGAITTLSNMTREYVYYVFEATLAHGANADRALAILREVGTELASDERYEPVILAPIEVLGVDRLTDHGMMIRARIQTIPSQQAMVGRELNRRVSKRWEIEKIPFPPVST